MIGGLALAERWMVAFYAIFVLAQMTATASTCFSRGAMRYGALSNQMAHAIAALVNKSLAPPATLGEHLLQQRDLSRVIGGVQ